jgi:ubiquinone/menaquinone biosynthesis C-methylase UbiE
MIEVEGRRVYNPAWAWALEVGRDGWQQPDAVLSALALPESAVVADIGAGGGYFTERFARALPTGRVFATDVQDGMIERLDERVRRRGLANVEVVRAGFDDPGLPERCCDLVFLSSVYKEIQERVAYMGRVRRLLRPGGRVAILEFRPGAPGAGPPEAMRLAPETIIAELARAGFVLAESHDFLPRESFLVFAVDSGAPLDHSPPG